MGKDISSNIKERQSVTFQPMVSTHPAQTILIHIAFESKYVKARNYTAFQWVM